MTTFLIIILSAAFLVQTARLRRAKRRVNRISRNLREAERRARFYYRLWADRVLRDFDARFSAAKEDEILEADVLEERG